MYSRFSTLLKPLSLAVVATLLSACGSEEVDFRQLKTTQGLYYKVNAAEPFTGTVVNAPIINSPMNYGSCRAEIKAGLKDGQETCQYTNGNKYSETSYVKGNKHGAEKRWLGDGFLYADLHWANGKPDGLNKLWNEKKQPVYEIETSNGLKSGIDKAWRDGVLEYDTVWKDGKQSGKYFWKDTYSVITNGVRSPSRRVGTDELVTEAVETTTAAVPVQPTETPKDCVAEKVKALHEEAEEAGEEIAISRDMLDELKAECGA